MRQQYFRSLNAAGFHQLAFVEWGEPANNDIVICAHGLTHNARYFDWFAKASQERYRVICPDTVGRGNSDWIDSAGYGFDQYLRDTAALLARLDMQRVDWLGTSMGGLLGICIAALPNQPIKRLVLNDVGPFVSRQALNMIADYIGRDERFPNHDACEAYLRQLYPQLGELTDAQWRHLAIISSRQTEDGRLRLAYDPAIRDNFRKADDDFQLWDLWKKIDIPVLILRGAESMVLTQQTLDEMLRCNSNAQAHVFDGIGHAPPLMADEQINVILDFLSAE